MGRKMQVIFLNHTQENGEVGVVDCKPDGTVASRLADEQSFSWLSDAAV